TGLPAAPGSGGEKRPGSVLKGIGQCKGTPCTTRQGPYNVGQWPVMTRMEAPPGTPGHPLERLLGAADRALRSLFAPAHASRPTPGEVTPAGSSTALTPALSATERRTAAALM